MPNKGFFTQGVAVLLKESVTLADLERLLTGFKISKRKEEFENWELGGPALVLDYRPEVNGHVSVDIVDRPWPDNMGDPKSEPTLFAAWSMGHFGPFAWPESQKRAIQHCYCWEEGRQIAPQHRAFLRIRTSYVFGAPESAPVFPEDCKPADELSFILRVVMALLRHPAALCYFNPNGEVLAERKSMERVLAHYGKAKLPPVDLLANRRIFKFENGWTMTDTVGMQQLDLPDIEACFHPDRFDLNDVGQFLANASLYLTEAGPVIKDGETIDGPGEIRFRAKSFKEGLWTPPRPTLRFRPEDGTTPPMEFGFENPAPKKKWRFW
ncbi:MAG: DUF4261 domain-containing protein [Planctomycetota bacterium]